jgi:hypothetical protein
MSASDEAWREEYRKKQAAGVEFECLSGDGRSWLLGDWVFDLEQKDYREKVNVPHLKERKLWLAQREAGTNEVWQCRRFAIWYDVPAHLEPAWKDEYDYRVKPKVETRHMALLISPQRFTTSALSKPNEPVKDFRLRLEVRGWKITGDIATREIEI